MSEAILAIDQGTSGTKAIVLDPEDGVVADTEVSICPAYVAGGGVEQDPTELLDSVVAAGRQAVAAAGRPIQQVALANQGETVLCWDPNDGRPLSMAIVWQDRRSAEICDELRAENEWVTARTGLMLDPYFSAPKMAWLRRHATQEGVVTTTDAWLLHRLCGSFVTDASTASRSLVMDLDGVVWDDELLKLFGLEAEALPRIVDCDETVGETEAFGSFMDVGGLAVDQPAALLAQGCWESGAAKCTFGTGAFLLANTGDDAVRSRTGLTTSIAWRRAGMTTYCVDGQVYTAGSAVRWLTEMGLLAAPDQIDASGADADGVLCVPALAGLAAPWWDAEATASFTGMTLATRREHLVVAVLQGIAAQVAELTDAIALDAGRPLQSLRVDGGLTRSEVLMQAVADVTRLDVVVANSPHATALGAAGLGRMAQQPGLAAADAVAIGHPAATYSPRWSTDQADSFRSQWRAVANTQRALNNSEQP